MADRILIAEDDDDLAFALREALQHKAYEAHVVPTGAELFERVRHAVYDLVLLDLKLPDVEGLDAIVRCRVLSPDTPIIVMTAYGTRQIALDAIARGAYDFFTKPLKVDEFSVVVARALERRRLQQQVAALQADHADFDDLLGESPTFRRVLDLARRAAPTDVTILIEGASGTGKERLAQAIHRQSTRKTGPFVAVNCAAIPEGLLESQLFGHERGAFTGAIRAKPGRFETARGGTLFLDEIGDMPPTMQAKILRALQEREVERVGSVRPINIDVRVIAATHQDLDRLVSEGRFRTDLFYRLQGVRIHLPALRERIEDLPRLVDHFLRQAQDRLGRASASLSSEALTLFWRYAWPGNVRELQHVLEGALLVSEGIILPEHLPPSMHRLPVAHDSESASSGSLDAALEATEQRLILQALSKTQGIQAHAAKLLGITEQSLWYRLKKYQIQARRVTEVTTTRTDMSPGN